MAAVGGYHLRWRGYTRLRGFRVALRGCLVQHLFLLIGLCNFLLINDTLQPHHFLYASGRQDVRVLNHPLLELAPLFNVFRNLCIFTRQVEKTARELDPVHDAGCTFVQRNWRKSLLLTSSSILQSRLRSYLGLPIDPIYGIGHWRRDIRIRFWCRLRFTTLTTHWSHWCVLCTCLGCSFFGLLTLLPLSELCEESSPLWLRNVSDIPLEFLQVWLG